MSNGNIVEIIGAVVDVEPRVDGDGHVRRPRQPERRGGRYAFQPERR